MSSLNSRRQFLFKTVMSMVAPSVTALVAGCGDQRTAIAQCRAPHLSEVDNAASRIADIGPLQAADAHGLQLPAGFTSRVIARSGSRAHRSSPYPWHAAPDGGAVFASSDGGWIYVSNSELRDGKGGAGAIRFDAAGNIVASYPLLENTTLNCAGGATPWGTWLSCEEYEGGKVWECDPYGKRPAVQRPALGTFVHEAVAVDPVNHQLYLTEDKPDGCFYRFTPDRLVGGHADLTSGSLEVAAVDAATCTTTWLPVPDPSAADLPTRYQVTECSRFDGGEGIAWFGGTVFFSTKGDNRIWSYQTASRKTGVLYDAATHPQPILAGVDNIALSQDGEILVAEDGDDLQIVAITAGNELVPLVQLVGHNDSEVAGPAFTPDGRRLIFSSQRGTSGESRDGMTFEISGPFHKAA